MQIRKFPGWLGRLALSIGAGIGIGLLAYLIANGLAGALLLYQQRELLSTVAGTIGSIETPPPTDLHQLRLQIEQHAYFYWQISCLVGLVSGALGALWLYLRFERQAIEQAEAVLTNP